MLSGKKTYIIAGAMLAHQLLNFFFEGTPPDMMGVLEALGLASLRSGVKKV
jgi:hypothetical protein